jgi:V8-like Glu-specific endopeptidase
MVTPMKKSMDPSDNIVPLLAIEGTKVQHFLGTAFFVVKPDLLLTADHRVKDWDGEFAVTTKAQVPNLFHATVVKRDTPHI